MSHVGDGLPLGPATGIAALLTSGPRAPWSARISSARRASLLYQRASPALFGTENLLFRQIDLTHHHVA